MATSGQSAIARSRSPAPGAVRLAEVVGVLSLATDLGTGVPIEHAVRSCLIGMRLAERLGLAPAEVRDVYYLTLLRMLGCTADSAEAASFFGDEITFGTATYLLEYGDPAAFGAWAMAHFAEDDPPALRAERFGRLVAYSPEHRREMLGGHCEVAQLLARRLAMPPGVVDGLAYVFERWDGNGSPARRAGEAIPIAARIMIVSKELDLHRDAGGIDAAVEMARSRSGGAFDPRLVELVERDPGSILGAADQRTAWESLLAIEPGPTRWLSGSALDDAARAIAEFADLKSTYTLGHSARVADLAATAAAAAGLDDDHVAVARHAGLMHDLGRVTVTTSIWDKPGPLDAAEREKVRLHPYYTERMVGYAAGLAAEARIAGAHHERLDGSGYHRGTAAAGQPRLTRILAAADAYAAMTEPRAYRPALAPGRAADELVAEVRAGRLDGPAVEAVIAAAGAPRHLAPTAARRTEAGLTDREVQVLRLAARGATTRQIATDLSIALKTADRHLQNIYVKAGVSTRAAATLFAVQHDLLDESLD